MDRKIKAIIKLISVGILLFCFVIIKAFTMLKNEPNEFEEKNIVFNGIKITYPYFSERHDLHISKYFGTLNVNHVDEIRYDVNFIDEYTSLIFKSYLDNTIVDYYSIFFDSEGNDIPISHIITDESAFINKVKDYIAVSYYRITEEEIDRADMTLQFQDHQVEIFLTNYNEQGNITLVILDYQEIRDYLSINLDIDDTYETIPERISTTTTTQPTTTIVPKTDAPRKLVAFSFDDGPSNYTVPLLNILDEYNAKATFFVLGDNMRSRPGVIWEILNRGHEVGNHTTDHKNLTSISIDAASRNIEGTNSLFNSITGRSIGLFRPPYGSINSRVQQIVGMPVILWSVDSRDWESRNTDAIVNLVLTDIQENDIVIFHDLYPTTIEAISVLLPILYADNFEVVSVSELFNRNEKSLNPGEIYRHAR